MQAAYDAAREAGVAEQVGRQLERLQSVARMVPELTRLLKHPTMTVPSTIAVRCCKLPARSTAR
jgi:F0F1-type ATP synthase delta subunit